MNRATATAETQHPAVSAIAPLLDLIRTTADAYGEVTFRVLPAGHEYAESGCCIPHERTICLPARRDPARDASFLVAALYRTVGADTDPRLAESSATFLAAAIDRTLAAMGGSR